MSTRFDILHAKAAYEDHNAAHGCQTGQGCPVRLRLWLSYQKTAERWAVEPGDDDRQRRQFYELTA